MLIKNNNNKQKTNSHAVFFLLILGSVVFIVLGLFCRTFKKISVIIYSFLYKRLKTGNKERKVEKREDNLKFIILSKM